MEVEYDPSTQITVTYANYLKQKWQLFIFICTM